MARWGSEERREAFKRVGGGAASSPGSAPASAILRVRKKLLNWMFTILRKMGHRKSVKMYVKTSAVRVRSSTHFKQNNVQNKAQVVDANANIPLLSIPILNIEYSPAYLPGLSLK